MLDFYGKVMRAQVFEIRSDGFKTFKPASMPPLCLEQLLIQPFSNGENEPPWDALGDKGSGLARAQQLTQQWGINTEQLIPQKGRFAKSRV
jgi:hypothetical protein